MSQKYLQKRWRYFLKLRCVFLILDKLAALTYLYAGRHSCISWSLWVVYTLTKFAKCAQKGLYTVDYPLLCYKRHLLHPNITVIFWFDYKPLFFCSNIEIDYGGSVWEIGQFNISYSVSRGFSVFQSPFSGLFYTLIFLNIVVLLFLYVYFIHCKVSLQFRFSSFYKTWKRWGNPLIIIIQQLSCYDALQFIWTFVAIPRKMRVMHKWQLHSQS